MKIVLSELHSAFTNQYSVCCSAFLSQTSLKIPFAIASVSMLTSSTVSCFMQDILI